MPRDNTCILLYLPDAAAGLMLPARMDERMNGKHERKRVLRGVAPQALPVEGALSPNNSRDVDAI
jgi:hypothetical protein